MMTEKGTRAGYTLEFKLEAVRLVQGGQAKSVTAKVLGVPGPTLGNWVRLAAKGKLAGPWREAGECGANGARAAEGGTGAGEDGARHFKKSDGVLREGVSVKYAWVTRHKRQWPISLQCEVLGVSTSGYFEHIAYRVSKEPSKPGRRLSDEAVLAHIKAAHAGSKGEYGWPRVWKELVTGGVRVGKDRIQKLMKLHGIKARGKRRYEIGRAHV